MRTAHTTKTHKAKCLAYRNGRRCGRVAIAEVAYRVANSYRRIAVCQECKVIVIVDYNATVKQESTSGFNVITTGSFSGSNVRRYVPV